MLSNIPDATIILAGACVLSALMMDLRVVEAELAALKLQTASFRAWVQFFADADLVAFNKGQRDTSLWLNPQVVMECIEGWAALEVKP